MVKRGCLQKAIFLFFVVTISLASIATLASGAAQLRCEAQFGSCPPGTWEDVFHLSSASNAHAELNTQSNYDWKVCCEVQGASIGVDAVCTPLSGTQDEKIVALSTPTNAHVENPGRTDYPENVCLSASTGSIVCWEQSEACNNPNTCVLTKSGETNAHAADCSTDPYAINTCCRYCPQDSVGQLGQPCCSGRCSRGLICSSNVCIPPEASCGDGVFDTDSGESCSPEAGPGFCPCDGAPFDATCSAACSGSTIWGYVRNISKSNSLGACDPAGCPVQGARVTLQGKPQFAISDATGYYRITLGDLSGLPFEAVVQHPAYETNITQGIEVVTGGAYLHNVVLLKAAQGCNADCTKADGLCHSECQGKGGCWFYSQETVNACDLAAPGIVDFGSEKILCCTGAPYVPVKATVDVTCGKSVISSKIPVLFKGRLAKMVITVFDSSGCTSSTSSTP